MSKKRPTESSWDSDEELLSDTAGISAFPKTSELDLLAEDGELDEEALLGLDESGAAYSNESMQPMMGRQRSKNAVSAHKDHGPVADQAFVFEVADTGDLEDELTGNELGSEMLGTYQNEGMDSYHHEMYDQNGSHISHEVSTGTDQNIYSTDMLSATEDCKDPHADQGNYVEVDTQSSEVYPDQQSGHYSNMAGAEGLNEDSSNVELVYEQPAQELDQVHLEYEQQMSSGQMGAEQTQDQQEQAYESDSDSDEDSRHNRGKFKTERTGVISLSAATERESIPDTLEINEEQAAQIKEFMSDKPQRGKGRGASNNRGRQSAHTRLGNRSGVRPLIGQGMFGGERMQMMNPRFQSSPGPRGPGMPPRGLMSPRPLFSGMRQMPPRGPTVGGIFNPMFAGARGPQHGGRFPGGPMGSQGPHPVLGPGALLEPMKQLLQRMRGSHPGGPRMSGPGILQRPEGPMGMSMARPGNMRGGHDPRAFVGSGPNRMLRPPQQLLSPDKGGPMLMRPTGAQTALTMPDQLRQAQPIRGRLPPHQRLGQVGAANRGHMSISRGNLRGVSARAPFPVQQGRLAANNKIFINPLFQSQQGKPMGLTRTVKMGAPVHQRKAKALLERAKQTQIKQTSSPAVALKRKSTGGDDVVTKAVKKEVKEESVRTVEKQDPMDTDSQKISSLLEEQKRKREMIQKRKELARQKLAEQKRKELEEKMKTEGNKIESIVRRSSTDERTVEKSGDAAPIKVVSRSMASRLGPPPASSQNVQLQNRGPLSQPIRGPQFQQQIRGSQSLQIRGPQQLGGFQPQQARGPQPQQIRGQQPQQIRGPRPQQMRGPQPQQTRGPQPLMRGPQPQQMRGPQPLMRGPQPQQMRGPQPQMSGPQPQMRGPQPQQMRGPQPQQIRGPQSQQIRNSQPQVRGNQPQTFRSISQQAGNNQLQQTQSIQHRLGGQQQQTSGHLSQQIRGPQPQLLQGSQQQMNAIQPQQTVISRPHQMTNPPPHQVRGQAPQQIAGQHVQQPLRGPPPRQIVGGPGPQYLKGPPPQQFAVQQGARPTAPSQFNPVQPPFSQMRGPPPGSGQLQTQLPPPAAPAQPRFVATPQFPQQPHSGYDASVSSAAPLFQGTVASQPSLAQAQPHHFAGPPPQHPPTIPSSNSEASHYNYTYQGTVAQPPPTYQQNYPPPSQPEYQQPVAPYSDASFAQPHQSEVPAYQYSHPQSQAYASPLYDNEQTGAGYESQSQQHYPPQQQGQANIPLSQDTSYLPSANYYTSPQSIQTVTSQTISSSVENQHNSTVGQKIQTIGQRIQPVTGTQMRSIIHNVSSPPESSTSARSVQHKTPTLHISRAVMEGNVPILPGSQKVIILNVPQMATRETLIRLCRHFGHVEGVNLMRDQNKAVVQFQKGDQAAKCVSKCDQKCLHKTRLTVKLLPS